LDWGLGWAAGLIEDTAAGNFAFVAFATALAAFFLIGSLIVLARNVTAGLDAGDPARAFVRAGRALEVGGGLDFAAMPPV
jgi:hypothetical protein